MPDLFENLEADQDAFHIGPPLTYEEVASGLHDRLRDRDRDAAQEDDDQMELDAITNAGTSDGAKKGWENRIYYHGHGRPTLDTGSEEISTGHPYWDKQFFVSHRPEVAKLYGDTIDRIEMQPDTKVLVEHSKEYNRLDRGNKSPRLLDHHEELLRRASAAGYHVVEFNDFHDTVGHVILDPSKIKSRVPNG